jgi:hypothetical protein
LARQGQPRIKHYPPELFFIPGVTADLVLCITRKTVSNELILKYRKEKMSPVTDHFKTASV